MGQMMFLGETRDYRFEPAGVLLKGSDECCGKGNGGLRD